MGNCLLGGMGEVAGETIQVVTANGGIMEFHAPVTAGFILEEFPCHAIFKSDDLFWKPLSNHEELHPGDPYMLLPLHIKRDDFEVKVGHVRSKSIPMSLSTTTTTTTTTTTATGGGGVASSYRMSFDSSNICQNNVLKRSNTDVFSRYNRGGGGGGVWKVKLVINPQQLVEILSQEGRTQELIESVRTVAKSGCGGAGNSNSTGYSDQWSIASSRASSQPN